MVTDSLPEETVPSILYCRVLYYSFELNCTVLYYINWTVLDSCVMTHMLLCYLLLTVPTILNCTVMYCTFTVLYCCSSTWIWRRLRGRCIYHRLPPRGDGPCCTVLRCTAVILPWYGGDRGCVPCCTVLYCTAVLLPGYGGDWGDVVFITYSLLEETVPALLQGLLKMKLSSGKLQF